MTSLNKNNSAVKRIMQEAKELANDPSTDYTAAPLEDDIFEWHCTIRGPQGTEFEGGLYHFRILLPSEYPFKPPSILFLTPSGRFELNTKICISFTNYHEELWQPAWGIRTAIIGLQGFFPLKGQTAVGVGSIESPPSERKRLAALSRDWTCPTCQQKNTELLPDPVDAQEGEKPCEEGAAPPIPVPVTEHVEPQNETPAAGTDVSVATHMPTTESPTGPASFGNEPSPRVATVATIVSQSHTEVARRSPPEKIPLFLDTLICVLLVLVFALLCRRIL